MHIRLPLPKRAFTSFITFSNALAYTGRRTKNVKFSKELSACKVQLVSCGS